ncbi:MAG: hypothetical protein QW835_02660 [Candidatus Hadarchaeum sp.]
MKEMLSQIESIPDFELVSVFVRDGAVVKQPHLRAVVERGKSDAIAVVSDRYNLVQVKDLFMNVVERCGEGVEGEVLYYRGKGDLLVFPKGNSVGLLVQNSVDLSSAVRISFCAKAERGVFRIPAEVAAPFVRVHTAKDVKVKIDSYLDLLQQVKQTWDQIVQSLAALELSREDIEKLKRDIGAGKRLSEIIDDCLDLNQEHFAPVKFWDFVQTAVKAIERRKFRSKFHLSRKIRKVSDAIIQWAVYEKIRRAAGPEL